MRYWYMTVAVVLSLVSGLTAQVSPDTSESPESKLLVVGTAHLDTQWRWTVKESVEKYIPSTFIDNYKLMDMYPDYIFSFEGAFRYLLMKEYYPEEFERVRPYVASGQWRVTGSWVDAVDVNIPSFESLVRHTLYGNGYFKREFGKASRDVFLPDCFGFGYALPSIAAHCGLESFSTQKLTWGCWVGNPFDIGIWKGVDGSSLIAAINPGAYVAEITGDLSRDTLWINAAERQGDTSGLYAAYRYFGVGDTGGAPDSASVLWLSKSIHSDGPLQVQSVGADDVIDLVNQSNREQLPVYDGELVMTRHGTGCYTSQATMKRWNRKNELLADAAERASVIAYLFGGQQYPREMLRDTWIRFLWHQFHDDLTGTSIPEAYEYSWNDEILCQNRFAAILTKAVQTTSALLDTRGDGTPLVVYNPVAAPTTGTVDATISLPRAAGTHVRVFSGETEYPCDVITRSGDSVRIHFEASIPPVGYAVFNAQSSEHPTAIQTGLSVSESHLENQRYRVNISERGDVSSIYDKQHSRELLSAPVGYEILEDTPLRWPAWEIDFDDISAAPLNLFVGKPEIRVVDSGTVSVAVEIKQKTENSVFRTVVRLSTGDDADRVEFETDIDWYEREKLLKLTVPTTTPNDRVTYDLGLGVIERGLNFEKRYEVPGQQWADLSSPDRSYGVAVLNDSRYGWDHPSAEKLRLTLIHTPGVTQDWQWVGDERSQDNGHHKIRFAIVGHQGSWQDGTVVWQAAKFNQPLIAFQTTSHAGPLGRKLSLFDDRHPWDPAVMINAVKLAENSNEIVVRVRDISGLPQATAEIAFNLTKPIASVREVNGQEEEIGPADAVNPKLAFALSSFQPKAFAFTLNNETGVAANTPKTVPLNLPFNLDGISSDDSKCDGDFDGSGYSLSGDLLPDTIDYLGIPFVIGPKQAGRLNTVLCRGQKMPLPQGDYNHLLILAASVDGPSKGTFSIDQQSFTVDIQDYADPIGRWNSRLSDGELVESKERISPPYINRMPVAWYGSHRHTSACENDIYRFTYLFLIDLKLPPNAGTLVLPTNENIRIVAATLANTPYGDTSPAAPLYDEARHAMVHISADSASFAGSATLSMRTPIPATEIHYTLDGTEPTVTSARYASPITVDATTTVKARGFREGYNSDYVAARTVRKIGLREAVMVENPAEGLRGEYYEGEWELLPDFDTLEFSQAFTAHSVNIPPVARDEDFGLVFDGFVKIPYDGVYAFSIISDDGSRLYVSDSLLVDNDGLHSDFEMSGVIGLRAGYHRFTATMFQCKGGRALGVSVAGPSLPMQPVPAEMFYHME